MSSERIWIDRSDLLKPTIPAIYRFRDADHVVIYIGMTTNTIDQRFVWHTGQSPWLSEAVSLEIAYVPDEDVRTAEMAEIHRYHPIHNKQCPLCGLQRVNTPLFGIWRRLMRECPGELCQRWHDLATFNDEVTQAIGPRPVRGTLRRTDPSQPYQRGNVHWAGLGYYR